MQNAFQLQSTQRLLLIDNTGLKALVLSSDANTWHILGRVNSNTETYYYRQGQERLDLRGIYISGSSCLTRFQKDPARLYWIQFASIPAGNAPLAESTLDPLPKGFRLSDSEGRAPVLDLSKPPYTVQLITAPPSVPPAPSQQAAPQATGTIAHPTPQASQSSASGSSLLTPPPNTTSSPQHTGHSDAALNTPQPVPPSTRILDKIHLRAKALYSSLFGTRRRAALTTSATVLTLAGLAAYWTKPTFFSTFTSSLSSFMRRTVPPQ